MKNEILREDKKIISTYFHTFFKFMFSRVLFQLDRKRNKIDYNYGFDRIESENNRFLSKVFDRNPRFPKKKKKKKTPIYHLTNC